MLAHDVLCMGRRVTDPQSLAIRLQLNSPRLTPFLGEKRGHASDKERKRRAEFIKANGIKLTRKN